MASALLGTRVIPASSSLGYAVFRHCSFILCTNTFLFLPLILLSVQHVNSPEMKMPSPQIWVRGLTSPWVQS